MLRRQVTDLDLLFQLETTFRETDSLLKAVVAVGNLARRKQRPIRIVAPPVLHFVAEHFGIPSDVIVSRSRQGSVVEARRVAMWLLRDSGLSLPKVGKAIGVHYSSVWMAIKKLEADQALMTVAQRIQLRIEQAREGVAALASAPEKKAAA